MSKYTLLIVITIVLFLFLNKLFGFIYVPLFCVPSGHVRVVFINESNEKIKAIKINGGLIKDIEIGDEEIFTFKQKGEGTYQFDLIFESGRKIKEDERYVENGYYIIEHIKKDKIETEY